MSKIWAWLTGPDGVVVWWAGIGIAVVLLGVVVWWLWWRLPKRQMRSITLEDPKARADVEDNFRKTVSQALGGIAVLIAAGTAYYGTLQTLREGETQAKNSLAASAEQSRLSLQAAAEQSRLSLQASDRQSQRNFEASTALLMSQQVAKGFEQLAQLGGGDKMLLHLGGIYALEGVLNGSEQYRQPVLEALCAFVRDGTRTHQDDEPPATDIQATLTVIGRREKDELGKVDLRGARIPASDLTSAKLIRANLIGANLIRAILISAKLMDANLTFTDLTGANLTSADLSNADLFNADLSFAILDSATLTGANLTGTDLTSANLTNTFGLSQVLLDAACGKPLHLPEGLTLDKPCPPRPAPTQPYNP